MAEEPARGGARVLRAAQLLLVLAAGALWGASRLPWVVLGLADGLGQPRELTVTGAAWSKALVPLALLCLAAAAAGAAMRGWQLRLLAVVAGTVSLACGYLAAGMWAARDITLRALSIAEVPLTALRSTDRRYAGAVLCLIAAVCVLTAAALLMRAAVRSSGSRDTKYAAPAVRRAVARDAGTGASTGPGAPEISERVLWDALDEGRDPTDDRGGPEPGGAGEGR